MAFTDRLKHAWNAFMNKDPTPNGYYHYGMVTCLLSMFIRTKKEDMIEIWILA